MLLLTLKVSILNKIIFNFRFVFLTVTFEYQMITIYDQGCFYFLREILGEIKNTIGDLNV